MSKYKNYGKNLSALAIEYELTVRRNNHNVTSDTQQEVSIALPLERHSPVTLTQSSNSDLASVSDNHNLNSLTHTISEVHDVGHVQVSNTPSSSDHHEVDNNIRSSASYTIEDPNIRRLLTSTPNSTAESPHSISDISQVHNVDYVQVFNTPSSSDYYEVDNNTRSSASYIIEHPNIHHLLYTSTLNPTDKKLEGNLKDELASADKNNDENTKNVVRKLVFDPNVLKEETSSQQNHKCLSMADELVEGSCSNIRAKKRSLEHINLIETKDQSSTEDLLVLENDLSDEIIENWEFEDQEFAEETEDTNRISTTDSEEVAIDDSSKDSPTTSINTVINTEGLSEGVDETKPVALNNEIHNINKKAAVEMHHLKAIIDVASASYAMPHNIIKNRLLNDDFMPIAAGDENKQGSTGIWTSAGYSISKQGNFSNHLPYKSRMAVMTIGGDIALGDSSILGIAYSNAKANLKFNSLKGKSRINSHILSIYSQHGLQRNFYFQLVGSAASSTIKSKIVGENKKELYVDNIILESNLTYRHSFSNGMQLLPTIGLRYNYLRGGVDKGQKQAEQTILVNHKHERILSSDFGIKVIFNPIEFGSSVQLTPTMHACLERRITNDRKILIASITQGAVIKGDVRVKLPRAVRNKYNVGAGLIAQRRNVKLQLAYNYRTQKSYKEHASVIQLQINL
ncbi:autotransporter outer membrane beta-barrel domain-containing protein [Rickettsia endosymbiont of Urophora cardui]|uniref:autotransporter outer membrane beta-barrel domain-containing protein n=1 Tax=Rickettsia endosymbiont of Urophora cardui TaxID=3066265 RepID=UPI00313D9AAE